MRLGIYGGSFDPIHSGHLEPVRAAIEAAELDRVVYLPTAVPPHKPSQEFAPACARYVMVELALLGEPRCHVSPHELTLDRPAYTIDSIEHFAARYPEAELFLLLGIDAYAQLESWRRWREIVERAKLLVLARPGHRGGRSPEGLPEPLAELLESDRVRRIDNPPVEVSATRLRRMLARGEAPPSGWLPELVLDYCWKYRLYR